MIKAIANFLARDTKVIGAWLMWLAAPHYADERLRAPLQRSCAEGQASLYINGIDPRFWWHPGGSGGTLVGPHETRRSHDLPGNLRLPARTTPIAPGVGMGLCGLLMTRRSCFNLHAPLTVDEQVRLTADYAVNMVGRMTMPLVTTMPLVMNEISRRYGKWTSSRAVQLTDGARDERCHRRGPVQAPNFVHVVTGHKRCRAHGCGLCTRRLGGEIAWVEAKEKVRADCTSRLRRGLKLSCEVMV